MWALVIQKNFKMRSVLLYTIMMFFYIYANAQDVSKMIKEADRLEQLPDESAAFHKFKEVLKIQPLNIYAIVKCSELCSRIGKRQTIVAARDDYYSAAKTYAGIALKIDPNNSDANTAMAMVLGRSSMAKTGKEKIENAREVKRYVDIALKNNQQNFIAWHILGRWHYELNNLNMLEKAAVKLLFGGIPPASLKESIIAFEKVRALAPGFLLNYFEMAKAYKQYNNKSKAKEYLNTMMNLPNKTEDDPAIKENGRALLKEWR